MNPRADGKTTFSTAYIVQEPAVLRVPVGPVPPAFADLNQSIRDLFTKNYNIGIAKIDLKTVLPNGMAMRGILQQDVGLNATVPPRSFGSVEHKFARKDYGLTLVEKWTTDNVLSLEASVEDKFLAGAKATFLAGLNPQTGKRTAGLKFVYRRPYLHLTTDVDLDFAGPNIRSSLVSAYSNLRFGGSFVFDSATSTIKRYNLALGMAAARYTLHAGTTNFSDFEVGVFSALEPNLEVGIQSNFSTAAANADGSNSTIALGAKYDINATTSVKGKVDSKGGVGLSHAIELARGVRLISSLLVNGFSLASGGGGHNYGFALEFDI